MDDNMMIKNLINIGVKFANLKKEETDSVLWEAIFENNLYEVNKSMLEQYFSKDDFWNKSYTYISSKPNIKKYIDLNIYKYIPIIIDCAKDSEERFFCDDESAIIDILNNKKIENRFKDKYIANMSKPLKDLGKIIDTSLWDDLLKYRSVQDSVDTIIKYFDNNKEHSDKKNNILINFINGINDLSTLKFDDRVWKKYPDIKEVFYKLILSSTRLTKSADSIIESITDIQFDLQEMPNKVRSQYVKILIDKGLLLLTQENIQEIINSYFEHINILIHKNTNRFCECLKNRSVEMNQSEKLTSILSLDNNNLTDDEKIKIICAYPDKIKYNTRYGINIIIEILRDHFVPAELFMYFKMYDDETPANRNLMYEELKRAGNIRDFEVKLKLEHPELYKRLVKDKIL